MTLSNERPLSPEDRKAAIGLFMASLAVYSSLAFFYHAISPDGFLYLELAKNIFHSGYAIDGAEHTKFLPFYPFLMALSSMLTGGFIGPDTAGIAINSISGAFMPPLTYLVARQIGASPRSSLLAGIVHLLLAVGLDQYRDISSLPVFNLGIMLFFFLAIKGGMAWAGLALGLAATTRFEAYLIVPLAAAANIREGRKLFWFVAGFAVAAGPWWLRNMARHGHFLHTYYFAEIMYYRFHHLEILKGLLLLFGPALLIFAGAGLGMANRKIKIYFAGYAALYVLLHIFWWFWGLRFLLPLTPVICALAGPGIDRLTEFFAKRGSQAQKWAMAAMLILALGQPVLGAGYFIYAEETRPPDPSVEAALALKAEPQEVSLLGTNNLELKYFSRHQAYTWQELKKGEDPNLFAFGQYNNNGVRVVVWSNNYPVDYESYYFLKDGKDFVAEVNTSEGKFRLSYIFLRQFGKLPKVVYVYGLKAEKISK